MLWILVRHSSQAKTLNFLQDFRIFSPEIQTLAWFTATIIGVALFSGKFLHWHVIDQIVGIAVLCGVVFLLFQACTLNPGAYLAT